MSDRARGVLAWTLYALTLLISLAALTLVIANQGFAAVWVGENDIGSLLGFQFAFGAVGALIISRQPRNVIGWLLITPAVMIAFLNAINVYLDAFYSNVTYIAHPPLALWLALSFETSSWVALIFPLLLIGQYFPDGRPVSPRWRTCGGAPVATRGEHLEKNPGRHRRYAASGSRTWSRRPGAGTTLVRPSWRKRRQTRSLSSNAVRRRASASGTMGSRGWRG